MKEHLQELLATALKRTLAALGGAEVTPTIQLDATKDAKFGDFQSNLALQLAKPLGKPPRAVADLLVKQLPDSTRVAKVEIAGPGFINFFLAPAAFQAVVAEVLEQGDAYGRDDSGRHGRIIVEFVSANPTGPMHVGHGRGAAYGDSISKLLAATGWQVWREYYINDAGRQTDVLAASVWLRYLEACGESVQTTSRRARDACSKRTDARCTCRRPRCSTAFRRSRSRIRTPARNRSRQPRRRRKPSSMR
jgi:arginyl-tRNA synthetase